MTFQEFLAETLASASLEVRALASPVLHLADTQDRDLRWALARVAFAVGHRDACDASNLAEVAECVAAAQTVAAVKKARYYRIGDTSWTRYIVVAVWHAVGADCAWLFPEPPEGQAYALDPSVPAVS